MQRTIACVGARGGPLRPHSHQWRPLSDLRGLDWVQLIEGLPFTITLSRELAYTKS